MNGNWPSRLWILLLFTAAGSVVASEGTTRNAAPDARNGNFLPTPEAGASDGASLYRQGSFELAEVRFLGGDQLPQELQDEFARLANALYGQAISTIELNSLRHVLNETLIRHGFVNSGVVIPDQDVVGGVVELQVIEGALGEIAIATDGRLRSAWLGPRMRLSTPFNIEELRNTLQLLERDRRIQRLDARVEPGGRPGSARLSVGVEEARAWDLRLQADNARSPGVGAERLSATVVHNNLSGYGDALSVGASITEGLTDVNASYRLPIGANWETGLFLARSDSSAIEQPFDDLDVDSHTLGGGVELQRQLFRTLQNEVVLRVSGEVRNNQTKLEGRGFSFAPGARNGESRASVVRVGAAWTWRQPRQVLSSRIAVTRGFDAFNATTGGNGDTRFTAALAQLQYATRLRHFDATLRALTQLTPNRLLSIEQLAVGGQSSVRGYRENQQVRDNGGLLSMEVRRRIAGGPRFEVTALAFADWARSWNQQAPARSIESMGVGVVGRFEGFDWAIHWGHAFSSFQGAEYDLQDDGIHFRFGWSPAPGARAGVERRRATTVNR